MRARQTQKCAHIPSRDVRTSGSGWRGGEVARWRGGVGETRSSATTALSLDAVSRQGAATRLHQNEAKTKNAPSSNAQMRRAQKMRRMYANEMCMSNHGAMIVPPGPATPSLGSVRSDTSILKITEVSPLRALSSNLNLGQDTRAEPKREGHRNHTERSPGGERPSVN